MRKLFRILPELFISRLRWHHTAQNGLPWQPRLFSRPQRLQLATACYVQPEICYRKTRPGTTLSSKVDAWFMILWLRHKSRWSTRSDIRTAESAKIKQLCLFIRRLLAVITSEMYRLLFALYTLPLQLFLLSPFNVFSFFHSLSLRNAVHHHNNTD
jgi:hypothetical protein